MNRKCLIGISALALTIFCFIESNANAESATILSKAVAPPIVFPLMAPRISSKYGPRKHPIRKAQRHHNGIDLAAPRNAHVRAVTGGVVVFADTYSGFGKLVTIRHPNGYVSLYGHLRDIRVETGERVAAGEIIGRVGSTGLATGPHLHFEWRRNGKSIDPLKVFPDLAAEADG